MKLFTIFLVFGLTVSEKLDRTYLPPPGALYAGGSPGDIQAPLESEKKLQPIFNHIESSQQEEFIPTGYSTVTPVTTTSYAFTQTTTFPFVESYQTAGTLIDSIAGLPVQHVGNTGYPNYAENTSDYNQNQDQNIRNYEGSIPGVTSSSQLYDNQYTNTGEPIYGQNNIKNYTNLNMIGSETEPQTPELKYYTSQGMKLNPFNQLLPDQQGFLTSTASTQEANILPEKHFNLIGSQVTPLGQSPQSIYSDQVINAQDSSQYVPGQNYEYSFDDINKISPDIISGQNFQPNQYFDSIGSSTPATNIPTSTLAFSSAFPINRPKRPQAEADRNAVILNYENVQMPSGYYYSYDTSNGIHADESGSVEDGTKAQGSYSYIGDDGKVYSIIYTADENGFQPRGDHLPTPPPIPEAIKDVIEQAARDKAAGIFDDGSYNEAKYGHEKYQKSMNNRHPQIQKSDNVNNGMRKPIAGLTENGYNDNELPNQFNNNIEISQIKNRLPDENQILNIPNKDQNKEFTDGIQNNKILDNDKGDISPTDKMYNNGQQGNIDTQYLNKIPEFSSVPNYKNDDIENKQYRFSPKSNYDQKDDNENINYEQFLNKNGYNYNPPGEPFNPTRFPARVKEDDGFLVAKPIKEAFGKGTTRRPFLTPEVYNQPTFKQDESYLLSNAPEPFMTSQVTTPKGSVYDGYNDGGDYTFNLVSDKKGTSTIKYSDDNIDITTHQPFESSRTTSKLKYKPSNQRSHIKNNEIVTPNHSESTVSSTNRTSVPDYKFDGDTIQRTIPRNQYQPNYSTDTNKQSFSQNYPTSYESIYNKPTSTTESVSTYPSKTYTYDSVQPVYGSRLLPQQNTPSPQNYQTSPSGPSLSGTLSTIPGFQRDSNSFIPSGTYQQALPAVNDRTNHYEPVMSKYSLNYPIPSTTLSGQIQEYSTTQEPVYPSTDGVYHQNFANDFGRPINFKPSMSYVGQEPIRNLATSFETGQESEKTRGQGNQNDLPQTIHSSGYTKHYDHPKIIGETFVGPKQPQGFDPETGYHYK